MALTDTRETWKTISWRLPMGCRDDFYEILFRAGNLYGCPIQKEPTNEFQPNLITILEKLTHVLREMSDETIRNE